MRKNILLYALYDEKWMGGIYYLKNILFQLSISNEAKEKYCYYMFTKSDLLNEFSEFIQKMRIEVIECNQSDEVQEQLILACTNNNIDVFFPVFGGGYTWLMKDISLYWIPDFQEIYLPENFVSQEIEARRRIRNYITYEHEKLILSSNDACNDYKKLCPNNIENVFVVHFTSYANSLVKQTPDDFEEFVMNKFEIQYEYVFVANQFWKHKNHIVVLKAMNVIINEKKENLHLICTGAMNSYGEKDEYVESLYRYVRENNLEKYVHFLGLVDRKEQLCIMKNAKILIQPSKFEGWGCSVEDGKALGKEILLSDINVHKEQQYPKSLLFPQDDYGTLADLIVSNSSETQKYDLKYGEKYVMQKVLEYSKELQTAIDSIEINSRKNYLEELEIQRKDKIIKLFGDLRQNQICIYGIGKCTEKMLTSCKKIFGSLDFIYSDSDEIKWGMNYEGGTVYPPSELLNLGVKRIVISSIKYQEDIYRSLEKLKPDIEIVKIYNSNKELNEPLWV